MPGHKNMKIPPSWLETGDNTELRPCISQTSSTAAGRGAEQRAGLISNKAAESTNRYLKGANISTLTDLDIVYIQLGEVYKKDLSS